MSVLPHRLLETPARALTSALSLLLALVTAGCVGGQAPPSASPVARDTISILSPRCAGVRSCVLGHVTAAETSAPVAKASVFLERAPGPGEGEGEATLIMALTDEQGVFTVSDPPPGNYRIAIYKEAGVVEVVGLELGRAGTTVLPIRLATGGLF